MLIDFRLVVRVANLSNLCMACVGRLSCLLRREAAHRSSYGWWLWHHGMDDRRCGVLIPTTQKTAWMVGKE